MARLRLAALALFAAPLACDSGGALTPTGPAIELGEVAVGAIGEAALPVASTEGLALRLEHPDLTAQISSPSQVTVTFRPRRAGPVEAILELSWPDRTEARLVRGAGRWPSLERFPERVELSGAPFVDVWFWPETDVPLALAEGSRLPPCPGAPCVELLRDREDRGLPAAARVRGPLSADTSFTVTLCSEPECEAVVPVRAGTDGPALVFAAAPVGQVSLRTAQWPGAGEARVDHPELSVVETTEDSVTVAWTPSTAGPLEASLVRDGRLRPVYGYAVEAEPCASVVEPAPLVFGAVPVGAFGARALVVRSRGPEACLLSGVEALGEAFSAPPLAPRWLEGGASAEVELRFSPLAQGRYDGAARIFVADAAGAHQQVELTGRGAVSDLELVTRSLDFGRLAPCTPRTRPVHVINHGHAPGRVLEATFTGPGAELLGWSGPVTAAPADLTPVNVRLEAEAGADAGTLVDATLALTLQDSAATGTFTVPVRAEVPPNPQVTDEFVQLALPKTDLLFVVDPSAATAPDLAQNIASLAQFAARLAVDLRVAVVGTAPGETLRVHAGTRASVFENDDPLFAIQMTETILAATEAESSSVSLALDRAYEAVTSSAAETWVRDDAAVSIAIVSGRDDDSPGDVAAWLTRFFAIRGPRNTNLFVYTAITGGPEGCQTPDFTAEPAPRHHEMAERAGGSSVSICSSTWARSLQDRAYVSGFGFKSRFFLTNQPLESTIEVWVNDVPVPPGPRDGPNWTYDFATNSVNFTPFSVPEPEAHITVRYRVRCQ